MLLDKLIKPQQYPPPGGPCKGIHSVTRCTNACYGGYRISETYYYDTYGNTCDVVYNGCICGG